MLALYAAARQGHEAVTKLLIAARCDIDLQEETGLTALHFAVDNGHASVTKQLETGLTALHFAVVNGASLRNNTPIYIALLVHLQHLIPCPRFATIDQLGISNLF